MQVILRRQKMLSLAQVLRVVLRCFEMAERLLKAAGLQGFLTKNQMRPYILSGHQFFPAFPGMKTPRQQNLQCFFRLARLIVESGEFDGQVVPAINQSAVLFETRESLL